MNHQPRFDGISLLPALDSGKGPEERNLLFFGGWHVGVNFDCGIQARASDGRRYLYAYNCGSEVDELLDMDSEDAVNLTNRSSHAAIRAEMIQRLGVALQADPRFVGYWSEFRVARYKDLPKAQVTCSFLQSTTELAIIIFFDWVRTRKVFNGSVLSSR